MLRRASLSNQAEFICFTHLPAHLILSAVTTVTAPGLILWPIHALSRQSVGRAEEGGCRSVCVCMCVAVCVCVCERERDGVGWGVGVGWVASTGPDNSSVNTVTT